MNKTVLLMQVANDDITAHGKLVMPMGSAGEDIFQNFDCGDDKIL
jgi:hypothetical protein